LPYVQPRSPGQPESAQRRFGDVVESVTVGMDEMVFGYDRPTLPTLVQYPQPQFLDMEWGYLPAAADGKPEMQNKLGILLNAHAEGLFDRFAFKDSACQVASTCKDHFNIPSPNTN
jgi:hypothetical protein